jgi:methyl-accepting chemotaxis protein
MKWLVAYRANTLMEDIVKLNLRIVELQDANIPLQRIEESLDRQSINTLPIRIKMEINNSIMSELSKQMNEKEESLRKLLEENPE